MGRPTPASLPKSCGASPLVIIGDFEVLHGVGTLGGDEQESSGRIPGQAV
jgi:hypothetical protein